MSAAGRVVIIGGGVTGLTAAHALLGAAGPEVEVTLLESAARTGGLVRTSPFAGLAGVDEAADAFLTRVPWALDLAGDLGLSPALVHPAGTGASVWHGGLHAIPADILMGVPAGIGAFARSGLFSTRGKIRAALEPLVRRGDAGDSIGSLIRHRFGDEIHERLVDPLVGSIYAADTDRFSLEAVPQIASLASRRSLLLAAAGARRAAPGGSGHIFAAPRGGMGALVAALDERVRALGATVRTGTPAHALERAGDGYVVSAGSEVIACDAVIMASPAATSAGIVAGVCAEASEALARWEHAGVVIVTMAVPASQWRPAWTGTGYLVPKPDQRWVTAASFGSNKWAHWNPPDGSKVLRVSLGRDGLGVDDHDDTALVGLALADLARHLDADLTPTHVRVSRWPASFPQYRPGHFGRLAAVESALAAAAPGVFLAGASYSGIGIPACISQARAAAARVIEHLGPRDSQDRGTR